MSAPTSRRALQLLPPCATTGIGSLPHTQLEMGLQMALQVDIPYLPQLPARNPAELMIPAALEGLPGLVFDDEGVCTVELAAWERGRDPFEALLGEGLSSGSLTPFEPSVSANRAFREFLWEVENRRLPFAKAQLAGPCTARWVAKASDGSVAIDVAGLDRQMFRLLVARALAMVRALRRAGTVPIFFLDEPGLYAFDRKNPRHILALQELKLMAVSLQREGALVGVHCCSNTDWPMLLGLGLDVLSLDVRLSLDALLEDGAAFRRFLASGAALSLGIIPTNLGSEFNVAELVESVEASLLATLPRSMPLGAAMQRMLLTPACGLAMRTVVDAERVFEDVKLAQRMLKARSESEPDVPAPTLLPQ